MFLQMLLLVHNHSHPVSVFKDLMQTSFSLKAVPACPTGYTGGLRGDIYVTAE